MKFFTQLRISELRNTGNFRATVTCRDSKDNTWELRGYGETVSLACADAMYVYEQLESDWHMHGYIVRKAKTRKAPTKRNYIKVLPLPDSLLYIAEAAAAKTYNNESSAVAK
jgi:hypothetical protein